MASSKGSSFPRTLYFLIPIIVVIFVFSRDPLILYIRNFVSSDEIAYYLRASEDKCQPSKSAWTDPKDLGWHGRNASVEPLLVRRYQTDGFYNYYFDWNESRTEGNWATTFMSHLVGDYTGGGTNFPFLPQPSHDEWCGVIDYDEEGKDGYQGTGHTGVYHASLPVRSGMKVRLNI
ncbi:putative prolyl 4-hydroxylase alpha subunit [Hypoxylon argillaceum]|nr:putative prolyl 4-hydroxylase alpha subunit [Hypoxylon argillaceum]